MKMFLISDNSDTLTGMRLAGIEGVTVQDGTEFNEAVKRVVFDKEIGILMITEKLAAEFKEIVDEVKLSESRPLIVEVPDRHGSGKDKDFISKYIREAIGVKI